VAKSVIAIADHARVHAERASENLIGYDLLAGHWAPVLTSLVRQYSQPVHQYRRVPSAHSPVALSSLPVISSGKAWRRWRPDAAAGPSGLDLRHDGRECVVRSAYRRLSNE
jgi:hypothetical protein